MQCPFCHQLDSRVVDSRLAAGGSAVWRRRACDACQKRFTTYERVEHQLPQVVKRDGQRQAFERAKLLRGLAVACNKRPVSAELLEELAEKIERELVATGEREIRSQEIGARVMEALKAVDEVAYVRFASVYKSFRDIDDFLQEMGRLVQGRG